MIVLQRFCFLGVHVHGCVCSNMSISGFMNIQFPCMSWYYVSTHHTCACIHMSVYSWCMHVSMCACLSMSVHMCFPVFPRVFIYIHSYVCLHIHVSHVFMHVSRWVYLSVRVCVHACICPCVYPACLCMSECVHSRVGVSIHISYACAHHMHTYATCVCVYPGVYILVFIYVSMFVFICPCMCTEVTLPVRCDCPVSFWSVHASLWGTGHGVVDSHLLLPRQP